MNKPASTKRTLSLALVGITALTGISGCSFWFAEVAELYNADAQFALQCANKHSPGSAQAQAAAAAAGRASEANNEAFQLSRASRDDASAAQAASNRASAAAGEATEAASQIPGCNLELAKRSLDGKYNQDIFGSQKRGPHT